MQFQIQVDGPSVHRSITLDASSAPLIVGRDAAASVHLPDPDKSISRKHVSLQYEQSLPPAILATVVSTVSSITSNHGELAPGQKILLRSGDSLQIGPYTLSFREIAGAGAATPASRADDPFAALGLGGFSSGGNLDPFQQAEFRVAKAPAASAGDPFESLMGAGNLPAKAPSSFSGSTGPIAPLPAGGLSVDPMAMFASTPGSAPTGSINDWLGAGVSGGLGASSVLSGVPPPASTSMARDHVHDFNLPLQLPGSPLQNAAAPAPVTPLQGIPPASASMEVDDWARLGGDWAEVKAGLPAEPETLPAQLEPSRDIPQQPAQPITSPSQAGWNDFGASWLDQIAHAPEATPPPVGQPAAPAQAAARLPASVQMPQADQAAATRAALKSLCTGLGIAAPDQISAEGWTSMGKSIRLIVEGLADLMNARAELKRELRAEARTMLHSRNNNPIKSGMSADELIQYLLFSTKGAGGFMPADRALEESVGELRSHNMASITATRAAVEGALQDFNPSKLKVTLGKGKAKLPQFLDRSRLWESYEEYYQKRSANMADWLEQVFDRHFMPAYSKETERLKRVSRQNEGPGGKTN